MEAGTDASVGDGVDLELDGADICMPVYASCVSECHSR